MVLNKLKIILMVCFCFIIPFCAEIFCAENLSDVKETILDKTKFNSVNENKEAKNFWDSLIVSPIQYTAQISNNLITFARKNPTYVMIITLMSMTKVTDAILTCYCYCTKAPLMLDGSPQPITISQDLLSCQQSCQSAGWGNVFISENLIDIFSQYLACGNYVNYGPCGTSGDSGY